MSLYCLKPYLALRVKPNILNSSQHDLLSLTCLNFLVLSCLLSNQLLVFLSHCSFCSSIHQAHFLSEGLCHSSSLCRECPFSSPQSFVWLPPSYHSGFSLNISTSERFFLVPQPEVFFNILIMSPNNIFILLPVPTYYFLVHL